jgi:hypothetical protein
VQRDVKDGHTVIFRYTKSVGGALNPAICNPRLLPEGGSTCLLRAFFVQLYLDKDTEIDILLCVSSKKNRSAQTTLMRLEDTMKVEQISIFVENKSGRLAEVTTILAKSGINIRALSLADTADFGILRLIVSDTEKTVALLNDNGFTIGRNEVVAVQIPDRPGGLAGILSALQGKGINVEYMYAFTQKSEGNAVLIFRFDEIDKALDSLQKTGVRILSGEEVQRL